MKKIILSLLIIILISAISYRVYVKYFQWKTYTNEIYKYSIKYPNNWFIDNQYSNRELEVRDNTDTYLGGDTGISNYELTQEIDEADRSLVYYNFQKVNRNIAIDNFVDTKTIPAKKIDTEDVLINDIKGIKYTIYDLQGIGGNTKKNSVTILLKKDDLLLNISYGFDDGNNMNIETMNKIINSIKW